MPGKLCNARKNATDYYMCSAILSRNETAGTAVEFFEDVLFSETYSVGFGFSSREGEVPVLQDNPSHSLEILMVKFYFLILG